MQRGGLNATERLSATSRPQQGSARYVHTGRPQSTEYVTRRDYFELTVEGVDDDTHRPVTPLVRIDFHGPDGLLRDRLSGTDGTLLAADDVDVAFRLREPLSTADDSEGVVGVTNRYTGDFILELNETATDVLPFIHAARDSAGDEDARYRVEIDVDGERLVTYDKHTFLVYDHEGNLLRNESLIPSGVEL